MIIDVTRRSIGVNFTTGKIADVRLWAPLAKKAILHITSSGEKIELQKEEYGYWHTVTNKLMAGDDYKFSLDKEKAFPDPASLSQLHGVHDASTAFDLKQYQWTDKHWKNNPIE